MPIHVARVPVAPVSTLLPSTLRKTNREEAKSTFFEQFFSKQFHKQKTKQTTHTQTQDTGTACQSLGLLKREQKEKKKIILQRVGTPKGSFRLSKEFIFFTKQPQLKNASSRNKQAGWR